jgi:two-component system response regulator YesN
MVRGKILVVDDEKSVRDTFTNFFDEYNVVTAADGQQALEILSRPNDIDLIVLDVVMPGLRGTELLRKIKMMNPSNKVIIITGYGTKEVIIEALRSHADEYIEKPFDIDKAKQVFERLLNKRRNFDKEEIGNTENRINQAQRFIKRNYNKSMSLKDIAKEIFLSPKYLSRIFKERTGRSFNNYKLSLRIKTAKQLLKKNKYTISQIAYKVGYQNPESFMKMFKKFTGLTPLQYRGRSRTGKGRNKESIYSSH